MKIFGMRGPRIVEKKKIVITLLKFIWKRVK